MENCVSFDREKCVKCGLCVKDCVTMCLKFGEDDYPAIEDEKRCIKCQHCFAICPTGAITFNGINPETAEIPNFNDILSIIKSRRSIRQFKNEEIDEDAFNKIKEMLPYIPTGCNSHKLHFSIVKKHDVMKKLKEKVNKKILSLMNNRLVSPFIKHFEVYKNALEEGEDIIFRNAPHMIVVSSPIDAPCAPTDPVIALSYIELYANSIGLGTCWCGYGEICMKTFPELSEILDIPNGYAPIYVMLLGKPDVQYKRIPKPNAYKISEINEIKPLNSCIFCKTKRFFTNLLR